LVLVPLALFRVLGMEPSNYPQIWQCVGMIVGVYGVGYAAAALAPLRHWPVVLAGLLGKILGPIAFLSAGGQGTLPLSFPFALILLRAYQTNETLRATNA
jgi:small multidrug resistance pump